MPAVWSVGSNLVVAPLMVCCWGLAVACMLNFCLDSPYNAGLQGDVIAGQELSIMLSHDVNLCHGQCAKVQGKIASPLCIAALQTRFTAATVSLQTHSWRCALHTEALSKY